MSGLRIYKDAVRLVVLVQPLFGRLGRHSRELRRQLERCAPSVPLNIAEGDGRWNGHGRERFETAIGSARETRAVLEVAVAAGMLEHGEVVEALAVIDKVIATLHVLLRKRAG